MAALTPEGLDRIELPCRDLARQRDFYGRLLGLAVLEESEEHSCYALGPARLVLRPRGNALFPIGTGLGTAPAVLLALRVPAEDIDRWHRRLLTNRVAVLDAPHAAGRGRVVLHLADPEGNVVELVAEGGG
jgi:catechol 2,3-dioxygenase-like lactoylglutathione lyase family enzyme